MHTGIVAGVAPGATISGFVVDHSGASAAYLVSLAAGVVAALAAQTVPRVAARAAPAEPERVAGAAAVTLAQLVGPRDRRRRPGSSSPADADAVVAEVRAAREAGTRVKMVGTGHSFTAIGAPSATMLTPGRPGRDPRRRPRRDDGHRRRRHHPQGPQRRPRARGPQPAQHGRHRRADPGRRHLDRHPRHRWAGRRRWPPRWSASSWSPAPASCCGRPPTRTPTSSRSPGSGSARSGVLTSVTFRVEPLFVLEAARAADVVGRGARRVRRDDGDLRPRRHVLVPAHRPDAHQAQHTGSGPT